ncbi:hypothetical protein FFLO_06044 [Filobasidium floriforme]|uniref:DNA polymerase epsilon subunit n=1 Tax=Filobasidium floriforme TaxID=5210 RepID=A0A8K0JHH9_9TREE|nr:putative DNA polymerase epsilon subunit B [Filobasidium floriforme]KAG7528621.1 hypothetical protein FFLO_06044 [Filobasidium floriforme]KAH8087285.1 putative DNA polymerase epsilon subunit B [Filobasidium floriforme]
MVNPKMRQMIVFSTKYSLTLPTQSLLFIEKILTEGEVPQEEWSDGLELWAKEYLRGEDPNPLISLPSLQKAYDSLSAKTSALEDADDLLGDDQDFHIDIDIDIDPEEVTVDSHFRVVGAFEMPGWRFDNVKGTFGLPNHRPAIGGPAISRSMYLRERWALVRQIVLRNENFTPPAVGGHDRANYLKLTSTRNLLGRQGQLFLLFGMLSRDPEGRLCLEDGEGTVVLDMEDAEPGEGLFTENCLVLIEGEYTAEETIKVLAMGHPPSERRDAARAIFGHVDFLGVGATSLKEEAKLQRISQAHEDLSIVVLSDVWLDHPKTIPALKRMFEGYGQAEFRPYAFVLCGNFSMKGWMGAGSMNAYIAGFKALAEAIAGFPTLSQHSQFIFIPGPTDPWSSSTLPRPPIPDSFVEPIRAKVPKATFTSNPARLKYFDQEIVIFREDLMGRMLRNIVQIKDGTEGANMKRYLVQTILDQTHLSPLPIQVRPTIWEWDHALRLYPMPTTVILADKYERYDLTYEGCHVFNPGSFVGNSFEWSVYYPATGKSESSALPEEE